jgi:LmbE family N-acetylglucosaminyl deacetylase
MAELEAATTGRLDGPGTAEAVWEASEELRGVATWTPAFPASGRAVVVAPHPDDEILGAGGTLALLAAAGSEIVLVAVTDGEASHPGRRRELRSCRPLESAAAARRLGIEPIEIHRLGHADGGIDEDRLVVELGGMVRPGDLLLAPWWRDGHPDHDLVGRASLAVGQLRSTDLLSYLVWTWHWASPVGDIPWAEACRVELGPEIADCKRKAVHCFTTQTAGPDPILPARVLRRLTRSFEIFLRP